MASLLDNICLTQIGNPDLGPAICVALTGAVAATGIGAAIAAEIFAACEAISFGMTLYCETSGKSLPGGPSIASELCNAEFLNFTITQDIQLIGVAAALPSNITSPPIAAPGEGPYPDINLDLGSETMISGFILMPPAPSEWQDYQAIAKVFCLKRGTKIRISIVGTDGYADQITRKIKKNQEYGEFILNVPGAEGGVRDVCTLEIILLDGTVLRRTASLVFGG